MNYFNNLFSSKEPSQNQLRVDPKFEFDKAKYTFAEISHLDINDPIDFRKWNGKYVTAKISGIINTQMGGNHFHGLRILVIEITEHTDNSFPEKKNVALIDPSCTDIIFRPETVSKFCSGKHLVNVKIKDKVHIKHRINKENIYKGAAIVKELKNGQLKVEYGNRSFCYVHVDDPTQVQSNKNGNYKNDYESKDNDLVLKASSQNNSSPLSSLFKMPQTITSLFKNLNDQNNTPQNRTKRQQQSMRSGRNYQQQALTYADESKEKQIEATQRCQFLIDSTKTQIEFITKYILKLNETLCAKSQNAKYGDIVQLEKELSGLNNTAAIGLVPFNLQCKTVRQKMEVDHLNVNHVFGICMAEIKKFEQESSTNLSKLCHSNQEIVSECEKALQVFTNCMKLSLQGKEIPQIPLFKDTRFNQENASHVFSNVAYHTNHTVSDKLRDIAENEQKYRHSHEVMKQESLSCNATTQGHSHLNITADQLLAHSTSSTKENAMTGKEQKRRFENEKQRDAYPDPDLNVLDNNHS